VSDSDMLVTVHFRHRVLTEYHRAFLVQASGTTLGGTTIALWKEEALPIQPRCTILTGTLTLSRIQVQLAIIGPHTIHTSSFVDSFVAGKGVTMFV
jgi:hypothetical protein